MLYNRSNTLPQRGTDGRMTANLTRKVREWTGPDHHFDARDNAAPLPDIGTIYNKLNDSAQYGTRIGDELRYRTNEEDTFLRGKAEYDSYRANREANSKILKEIGDREIRKARKAGRNAITKSLVKNAVTTAVSFTPLAPAAPFIGAGIDMIG